MTLSKDPRPIEEVSATQLREIFNQNGYLDKLKAGIIKSRKTYEIHHAPDGEPFCTHSQILFYYNLSNQLLAVVHQYRRPDGTLGASGKPDPKKIYLLNKILIAIPDTMK